MKNFQASRRLTSLIALAALAVPFTHTLSSARDNKTTGDSSAASVIRVAPPAPVFDDATRLAELAGRRARVAEKIGANGVLILLSATPRVYTNDVDYEFRQENNL